MIDLRSGLLLLLLLSQLLAPIEARAIENDCDDPYWSNTLRCKLLPNAVPQPVPAAPANAAAIREYTRVQLDQDLDVRCVDGTRPILYVDEAAGGPSNKWLISFTGGDSCSAEDLDDNGTFESGQDCLDYYIEQQGALMGTANEPAMRNLTDDPGPSDGILNPDPALNPVFAGYNRVRVWKCGFDRHSGRAFHPGVAAQPPAGPAISYDLYNQGQKIALAAFEALEGLGAGQAGLTYTTWVPNGNGAETVQRVLPSIADATQVLLVGHSAAAHGLFQNADRYSAYFAAMPGFQGDVRAVHDAHFMHPAENEAAFDPAQNPDPLLNNTLFDQRYTGTTAALGPYNAQNYHASPNSRLVRQYAAWLETPASTLDTILDASCVAAHANGGDTWKCRDRFHVRHHHETTPALVREDYTDPNTEHTRDQSGYPTPWGPVDAYPYCEGFYGFTPCAPALRIVPEYLARLNVRARHFLAGWQTLSELATGADTSGAPATVFLWQPNCGAHEGVYDDVQYYVTRIVGDGPPVIYREFIQAFVQAPRTGVVVGRVVGLNGATSECTQVLFRDGFEAP